MEEHQIVRIKRITEIRIIGFPSLTFLMQESTLMTAIENSRKAVLITVQPVFLILEQFYSRCMHLLENVLLPERRVVQAKRFWELRHKKNWLTNICIMCS